MAAGFFTVELLNGGFHLGLAVTQLPEAKRLRQGTLAYLHEGRQPLPDECLIDFFLGGALLLHLLDDDFPEVSGWFSRLVSMSTSSS